MRRLGLLIILLVVFSSCRKDIAPMPCTNPLDPACVNYHPCNAVQPVTADFEMWYGHYFPIPKGTWVLQDSVFPPGHILFRAKLNGAKYQWILGKDTESVQQDYRLFTGNFPGDTSVYGTYYNTLTVWKTPNKSCYPNDVSTATLMRKITIVRPSKLQTTGLFKVLFDGYADSNIIQIQPWDQNFATNPFANRERIGNRIFMGFKNTRTDTTLAGEGLDFWYLNTIIHLGDYYGPLFPYGGQITVNPITQVIEGNYKINIPSNGQEIIKQHHFKGRRL